MTRLELRRTTTGPTTSTIARTGTPPQAIDTVLVKTASRCNLNCTYCYVYNLGDDGWKSQPRRMSSEVLEAIIDQVGELSHRQDQAISVVLHGGEPLLLGFEGIQRLVEGLKGLPPPRRRSTHSDQRRLAFRPFHRFVRIQRRWNLDQSGRNG